jgi:ankyrin repeat protein
MVIFYHIFFIYFTNRLTTDVSFRIPFTKSKELAERYGVLEELGPIFNFELDNLGVEDNGDSSLLTKEQAFAAKRKMAMENAQQQNHSPNPSKRTQKAQQKSQQQNQRVQGLSPNRFEDQSIPRKKAKTVAHNAIPEENNEEAAANERDRSILMSIFLADKPEEIPDLLRNSQGKTGFNIDMVIDEQGHTALHWGTALARTNTVELLVSKGANIACTSYAGETPLMRGVMVTNSYDNNSFSKTVDLLKESIPIVDNKKRSVLHHAALTAGIQGRTNAAVYYMKNLVNAISGESEEVKSVIDAQDSLGDTALTIAARLECQSIVDLLIGVGATQSAENNNGLQMKDYSNKVIKD